MGSIISLFFYLAIFVVFALVLYFIIKYAVKAAIEEVEQEKNK